MKPSDALAIIREKFLPTRGHDEVVNEVTVEVFSDLLEAVCDRLPYTEGPTGRSILFFLFCGCIKFDRWMATPYLIKADYRDNFDKFVNVLCNRCKDTENGARFLVDQIKWDIFTEIDRKPLDLNRFNNECAKFEERLIKIPIPSSPIKKAEILQLSDELRLIIQAIRDNSIRTVLRTKIPIVPVDAQFTISTKWRSIDTTVVLQPIWFNPSNTMLNPSEGLRLIPTTPSQWQNGYCEVEIEFKALLDHTVRKDPLAACLSDDPPPEKEWSLIFVDIYEILDAVIWRLREQHKMAGKWILLPTDIATIEWQLYGGEDRIGHAHKDPSLLLRGTNEPIKQVSIKFDIAPEIEWHSRSYWLARSYLETGEINESLFWINVAAEALFEKRCKEMCTVYDVSYDELSSAKAYWDRAKDIVDQYLSQAQSDLIIWPEAVTGTPSWFARIRFLSKRIKLKKDANEILARYSHINRYRNALFHGIKEDPIPVSEAQKALENYQWLEENFFPIP